MRLFFEVNGTPGRPGRPMRGGISRGGWVGSGEIVVLDCVTREAVVPVGVDQVWSALTDPGQVARWFGDTAEIDLRVGGPVRFTWPAGEVSTGVVTAVEPLSTFAFSWDVFGTIGDPKLFTHVEFRLRPVAGGTSVRVLETGLDALVATGVAADPEDLFEEHVDGWRNEMSDLVRHLEGQSAQIPASG
jgi:uncharacterized protein YndB with AHSA1/START domain